MATIQKLMFRGPASTQSNMLYTVPESTDAVITNIVVTNSSGSEQTFTITVDGFFIASQTILEKNSVISFDIKQVLHENDEITGFASSNEVIFHISGVEIS